MKMGLLTTEHPDGKVCGRLPASWDPLFQMCPQMPQDTLPPPAPRIPISLWFRNFPFVLEEAGLPAAQLFLFIWVIIGCLL